MPTFKPSLSPSRPPRAVAARFAPHPLVLACALLLGAGPALGQPTAPASAPAAATPAPAAQTTLPAVEVRDTAPVQPSELPPAAPGGKVARGARLGVLGNVDVMETPFHITAYTADTVADEQARTVGDVLRHDPSVRTMTNQGHMVENFTVRGLPVYAESIAINGLYGMAPHHSVPVEMFERIELLKGPGAMLVGVPPTGDVGGAINLVPKRAGEQPLTRLTTGYATRSSWHLHADVGRRFGPEQRLGLRVNGLYGDGGTHLDHQTRRRGLGALALDYRGSGFKLEMDAYAMRNKIRKGSPSQVILRGNWAYVPDAPDGSTNFFYGEDVYGQSHARGLILRGEVDLAPQWTAFAALGASRHGYDGFIFGTRPVWAATDAATGNATGTVYNSWGDRRAQTYEAGVRGRFATGAVTHNLALTAHAERQKGGLRGNGQWQITDSNIYHPTPVQMPAGADPATYRQTVNDANQALSVVDTLGMLDDRLQVTLGVRAQRIHQKAASYKKNAVTPLLGVVAKPWGDDVSLYANYAEGLSPGQVVGTGYSNEGETLAPYKTRQAELGVKWRMGEITHTFSLFEIRRPSLITTADNAQRADGQQRNRGLEWSFAGKLTRDLSVLGGLSYTKATLTRTQGGTNQGNSQWGVPNWLANLGVEWAVPAVPGLALSGRVNHTGSAWLNEANSAKVPAWTTVDLGLRYATRVAGTPVVLRGGVHNVANKRYWDGFWGTGRLNVGAPRTFHLTASVDF
ncbi:MAG: TonB-dependent siderophore receptor [Pseudomonadota bacterium]|nr:TonB-dependent siderophore receptor [Pseudomonadota bacterium]